MSRYGGAIDRYTLDKDSALGAAWKLGENRVHISKNRIKLPKTKLLLPPQIVQKPLLNAVASKLDCGYAISVFWPLILTMQGVAAAIWADSRTAPQIGDISALFKVTEFNANHPPGFDLFLGLNNLMKFDPSSMRSGVRRDHVDAIADSGDERFELFLVTWKAAVEFVWNHELAHILYGHVDMISKRFASSELHEVNARSSSEVPAALSQFMEYVADMDGAMQLFASFYGTMIEKKKAPEQDTLYVGAAITLGVIIAIYVLQQGAIMVGKDDVIASTHPPLAHRAAWVLGAESKAIDEVSKKLNMDSNNIKWIKDCRKASMDLMRSTASLHHSLNYWINRIDDDAEAKMNDYVQTIHTNASPFFDELSSVQMV